MAIIIPNGFEVRGNEPVDGRMVTSTITTRNNLPSEVRYVGLIVYVSSENKIFQLRGGITNSNWFDITIPIVSLTSTTNNVGTITPNFDININSFTINSSFTSVLTINAPTSLTGATPLDGQSLVLRLRDNGVSRTLSFITTSGGYRPIGVTLPPATNTNRLTYIACIYNQPDQFWDVVGINSQL